MSPKRGRSRYGKNRRRGPVNGAGDRAASPRHIGIRRVRAENVFELVHPPCVRRRAEDLRQVHAMLEMGEVQIAVDELRWLLEGCRELLEAHKLLGEIAFSDGDLPLARAHFGYAYDLGRKALPKGGLSAPLPYSRQCNQPFFDAGKDLAKCLDAAGEKKAAAEVLQFLLELDPSDPLALTDLLA